jgi:lipid A oxidase
MKCRVRRRVISVAMVTGLAMLGLSGTAKAELEATLYSGMSASQASDVQLNLPNDTQLTFQDVSWDDMSFENPIYWGLRLTYWLPRANEWGIAVDFTHAKIQADLNQTVSVTGTRLGSTVNAQEPLSNTFAELAMTHGFNLLTINGVHRWQVKPRMRPFAGFGVGLAYPHVEVKTGASQTEEYQLAGWVMNVMAGLNYQLGQSVAIFGEYKLSYVDIRADLNGGGQLATTLWTNHFNIGMTYQFK